MGSVKMLNHLFAVSHFTQFMRIDHLALCQNSRKRHTRLWMLMTEQHKI